MKDIKKLREERGLSIYKLAKLSTLSAPTIREIELGKQSPTLHTLSCLANALNLSVKELLEE